MRILLYLLLPLIPNTLMKPCVSTYSGIFPNRWKNNVFSATWKMLLLYTILFLKILHWKTKDKILTLSVNDIVFIEANGRKIIVHTITHDYESIRNMQYWLEALPQNCFIQSHRSFIVNLKHVSDFNHDLIHLGNGQFTAYLTKRKYTEFKNAYLLYLESRV